MKTNQMMEVAFSYGIIKTKHKTMLGSLKDVEVVGNLYRASKGLEPKSLQKWLELKDTWEFIETLNKRIFLDEDGFVIVENSKKIIENDEKSQIPRSWYLEFQANNMIAYGKMIKKYPDYLIKSQRGGKLDNRGVWANLYIMIKFAMWLDKDFEIDVINTFITNKILLNRDNGGEEFKRLNKLLDTLPDRINKDNKGVYIQVARKVNEKIKGEFKQTWNKEGDDSMVQDRRGKLLDKLSFAIEYNFITSYPQVKEMIETYKF